MNFIWRTTHRILALAASLFIILASITGSILAIEPVLERNKNISASNKALDQDLGFFLAKIKDNYPEISRLDRNQFDQVSVEQLGDDFDIETFYINPINFNRLSKLGERHPVFEFTEALHRSLFLKSTGRLMVGFTAICLVLLCISGSVLLYKRYGSWYLFKRESLQNTWDYWHSISSKYSLVILLIIAFSGSYLSIDRFFIKEKKTDVFAQPQQTPSHKNTEISLAEFKFIKNIKLRDLNYVQFPFSDSAEDYYLIKTNQSEVLLHQYTGQVISEVKASHLSIFKSLNYQLHTGHFNSVWSILIGLVSLISVFIAISGLGIWILKMKRQGFKNKTAFSRADILVLVGSQTGSTFQFAKDLVKALQKNSKVHLCTLNNYKPEHKASLALILTATYGDGEPPENARHALEKLKATKTPMNYAVLGFGSKRYPKFCAFAKTLDHELSKQKEFNQLLKLTKIDQNNCIELKQWIKVLSNVLHKTIDINFSKKEDLFQLKSSTSLNRDSCFCLELTSPKHFKSGDWLSISAEDGRERLYSMANINNKCVLSIKKHEHGVCSTFLSELDEGQKIHASIKSNPEFHLPKDSPVLMICNGTGIAPFLGMISEAKPSQKLSLISGFRTKESLEIYEDYLKDSRQKLDKHFTAFSREDEGPNYVQDLIKQEHKFICQHLSNNGIIMICGSLAMEQAVKTELTSIVSKHLTNTSVDLTSRIRSDCY
ncbi:PepSY domain-containing protein [Psychroflexus sp. ALD_RP9]|uniref:PepSY domain-containing protein n=1 Tax=Psychroflexus sp. ALD_RP9 TaxID=2777186 RepID=UPI001A8EFB6B|nr:PepSY domain-containing protein [Psychroflexus sp. ALD_RP9]QSS96080.1 PepSY domain-containing protein [Psychroflexus sp. ALD_RP9]